MSFHVLSPCWYVVVMYLSPHFNIINIMTKKTSSCLYVVMAAVKYVHVIITMSVCLLHKHNGIRIVTAIYITTLVWIWTLRASNIIHKMRDILRAPLLVKKTYHLLSQLTHSKIIEPYYHNSPCFQYILNYLFGKFLSVWN